jgi:hypothetical protein
MFIAESREQQRNKLTSQGSRARLFTGRAASQGFKLSVAAFLRRIIPPSYKRAGGGVDRPELSQAAVPSSSSPSSSSSSSRPFRQNRAPLSDFDVERGPSDFMQPACPVPEPALSDDPDDSVPPSDFDVMQPGRPVPEPALPDPPDDEYEDVGPRDIVQAFHHGRNQTSNIGIHMMDVDEEAVDGSGRPSPGRGKLPSRRKRARASPVPGAEDRDVRQEDEKQNEGDNVQTRLESSQVGRQATAVSRANGRHGSLHGHFVSRANGRHGSLHGHFAARRGAWVPELGGGDASSDEYVYDDEFLVEDTSGDGQVLDWRAMVRQVGEFDQSIENAHFSTLAQCDNQSDGDLGSQDIMTLDELGVDSEEGEAAQQRTNRGREGLGTHTGLRYGDFCDNLASDDDAEKFTCGCGAKLKKSSSPPRHRRSNRHQAGLTNTGGQDDITDESAESREPC